MNSPVVVLCADKNIEIGLHVTLYSLLDSASGFVTIYLVQKGYAEQDLVRLHRTLSSFKDKYALYAIPFDDSRFEAMRGLHGNRMPYAKLVLADLVPAGRAIFLDSDLVVNQDIYRLYDESLDDFLVGATGGGIMGWSLEQDFYASLGYDMEAPYFSSGVMLMDLDGWRKRRVSQECLEVAERYGPLLRNTDQQVLNTVFYKNFKFLDLDYNHVLWPSTRRIEKAEEKIYHFGGVPKPWDLLGEYLNCNAQLYLATLEKTDFRGWRSWKSLQGTTIRKFLRTPRSYLKLFGKRLRNRA